MNEYKKIKTSELITRDVFPCDIYIQINPQKFIKIYPEGDFVDITAIYKYKAKGVLSFFIRTENHSQWLKASVYQLSRDLSQDSIHVDRSKEELIINGFSKSRELIQSLGVEMETLALIQSVQDECIVLFRKRNLSLNVLSNMIKNNDFLAEKSFLVATVSCAAALSMSWSTKKTLQKFILTSLFHDIALTNTNVQKIRVQAQLSDDFTPDDIEDFLTHPLAAKELFISLGFKVNSVEEMIMNHHELPDGSGFPTGLNSHSLSPHMCLFILAEEIAFTLILNNFSKEAWSLIKIRFETFYNKGNFKTPLKGLKALFTKYL